MKKISPQKLNLSADPSRCHRRVAVLGGLALSIAVCKGDGTKKTEQNINNREGGGRCSTRHARAAVMPWHDTAWRACEVGLSSLSTLQ